MLLDFAQDESRSDRVQRPRWNVNRIACLYRDVFKPIFCGVFADSALEFFARGSRSQAREHFRAGLRTHHVPHFRLAAAAGSLFMPRGIIIRRMNLDGEFLLAENKFHEKWEWRVLIGCRAGPFGRHRRPGFGERFASKRAVRKFAFVASHPGFADRLTKIRLLREKRREGKRAPRAAIKNRFEPRRTDDHIFWWKKLASRRRPSSIRSIEVA